MKISACSVSFRNEPFDIFQICDFVAGNGIEFLEIWGNHLDLSKNFEKFCKNLSKKMQTGNLSCSIISPYFDLTGNKQALQDSLEHSKLIFEIASLIDAPQVRVFTGTVGSKDASPEIYDQCVMGLKKMSELADPHNIRLSIETHPNTLVDTLDATRKLLSDTADPNIGLNLDIFHLWEVHFKTIEIYERLKESVFHMHAKNAKNSLIKDSHQFLHGQQARQKFFGIANLEDGDMPYDDLLRYLVKHYTGTISIEWFGQDPEESIKKDLLYMRKFEN